MASIPLPECVVCLQPFDDACNVPRVLNCGHSVCESCIASLSMSFTQKRGPSNRANPDNTAGNQSWRMLSSPQDFSQAGKLFNCPECGTIVRVANGRPDSLPRNVELMRLVAIIRELQGLLPIKRTDQNTECLLSEVNDEKAGGPDCLLVAKEAVVPNCETSTELPLSYVSPSRPAESLLATTSNATDTRQLNPCINHVISLKGNADYVSALAVGLGGDRLYSASFDKVIRIWSTVSFALLGVLSRHRSRITALTVAPWRTDEHEVVVSGDNEREICIWQVAAQTLGNDNRETTSGSVTEDAGSASTSSSCVTSFHEHDSWRYSGVCALEAAEDLSDQHSGLLYSGSGDHSIKIWSADDWTMIARLDGHVATISALLVHAQLLYSASWDGTVRMWLRADHSPLAVLEARKQTDPVLGLDLPPPGVRSMLLVNGVLYLGRVDGSLQAWRDSELEGEVAAQQGVVGSLCFDGRWLYSASWDGTILAWDVSAAALPDRAAHQVSAQGSQAITALVMAQGHLFGGTSGALIEVWGRAESSE